MGISTVCGMCIEHELPFDCLEYCHAFLIVGGNSLDDNVVATSMFYVLVASE